MMLDTPVEEGQKQRKIQERKQGEEGRGAGEKGKEKNVNKIVFP